VPVTIFFVGCEKRANAVFMENSNKMHIVVDENIPFGKEAFSRFGDVTAVAGRTLSRSALHDTEMVLVRSVTNVNEELLDDTPVKFVASATIGIDHIDLAYLHKSNIGFAYAPGSNAESVAEYIVAALVVLSRRTGRGLDDLTIGIIGVGNVGSRVCKHALTLGCRTLLCDPPKKRLTQCEMYRSLDEVLAESDIVSLHVPLVTTGDDRTMCMVDTPFIDRMKQGAVLMNTSRGKVVDEASVLSRRDHLGGLVLDVWDNEPAINSDLVNIADIATPHIAGYSFDGKVRGTLAIYNAACAYFYCEPEWSPPPTLFQEPTAEIVVSNSADSFYNTILQAYPIETDDRLLRKIISLEKAEQPHYFDELRKKYPKRREFPCFSVRGGGCKKETLEKLRRLGFRRRLDRQGSGCDDQ
jgi:erythronate-4-phosphate dehydrogenase